MGETIEISIFLFNNIVELIEKDVIVITFKNI